MRLHAWIRACASMISIEIVLILAEGVPKISIE